MLWYTLEDLTPIVKCLPEDVWYERFTRDDSEYPVYRDYTILVGELVYRSCCIR